MEALNSTSSRHATAQENMRSLEKAITTADQRIRIRRYAVANAQLTLAMGFFVPFCSYMIYHCFAAGGVMQNYKSSSGAYMNYAQTWMLKPRMMTNIYRPELEFGQQGAPLHMYTQKIEGQRRDGTLPEGVHHPTSWL